MTNANPCALTSDDFKGALFDTMPRGKAWPKGTGTVFGSFWSAVADFFLAFQTRACTLLNVESFPGTAVELLPDWERALGLPDPCITTALTITQRQAAAVAKFAGSFSPTPAGLIAYALSFGFTITITYPGPNQWAVHAHAVTVTYFRAGNSFAGDRLSSFTPNLLLECIFRSVCPAHTQLTFVYDL